MKKTNITDYFLQTSSSKNYTTLQENKRKSAITSSQSNNVGKNGASREIGAIEELDVDSGSAKSSNLASPKTRYVNKKLEDLKVDSCEEKSFPIPYNKFLQYTNVLELVDEQIKIARRHSYEQFISNMAYVHKIARRCYLHFYMQPKSRKRAPLKDLTVSEDCPKELKEHLMDIPEKYQIIKTKKVKTSKNPVIDDLLNPKPSTSKSCNSKPVENSTECFNLETLTASSNCPPPSFKVFKKFVNFEDEIKQRISGFAEENSKRNNSNLREKFELEFYKKFYGSPTLRHKLNWKLRPCPRRIREQILTNLPLEDETLLPERPAETDNIPAAKENQNELKNVQEQQKEVHNFEYPISFELFKKYTYQNEIVDEIFKATSEGNTKVFEEFKKNEALRESTFQNYYEAFYRAPQIREKFKIKMKPCPSKIKNLVLQVPTEADEADILKSEQFVNLMPSNKRPSSPSKTLVSPQAKKQKTMETIDLSTNTPTTTHTDQQLISNNDTSKNVQVKTISSTNFRLLMNYCDKKTVHFVEEKRKIIHKIIKELFTNANAAGKSATIPEHALKEVVSPKSNAKSMLASKTHSSAQKKIKTKIEMSKEIQERPLEPSLLSEVHLASSHDSDETDVNSELERTTVRNVQIRPKDKQVAPRSCTANFKRKDDDAINKLEYSAQKNTLVKGGELMSQKGLKTATSHHTQKAKIVGEKVINEQNDIESKKSVPPKNTCAYLARAYDSDDTDVNSELETTAVRNVSVRSMAKQPPQKNCNANLNPNGSCNINELENNAQKNTLVKIGEVMSQKKFKSATSHHTQEAENLGSKVVNKGNENDAKKKSVSPQDRNANQASAHNSHEADSNSELEMTTVRNVSLHSKKKELPSKTCTTDNLNPGNRSNIDELQTEELVKERQVQSREGSATLNATHHTQESRIVEDKDVKNNKPVFHNGSKENTQLSKSKLNINKNTQVELTSLVKIQPLSDSTKQSMLQYCINDTFFLKVDKNYTLAFAVRRSRGLKQRILLAILKMSMKEFAQYTRIYERPKFYEDSKILKKVYEFAITTEQIWPPNLYMILSDILDYLMSKGIAMQDLDLQHISPKILHFEELSIITNFDEIVHLDYFKEKAKKLDESQLKERRHSYYNRCWAHDEWIWRVPTLYENWELIVKHKNTDIITRIITPPLTDICTYTEDIEITEASDIETNSTSINRAADEIEPQETATEHLVESSWGLVLTDLEKRAQGLKSTEDDVETVIFPISQKESTSVSQKSYKTNDSSVKDMQDIQAKKIPNDEEFNLIETSDENKASTSAETAETVNQKSIILNSLDVSCSQTLSKSNGNNQVQNNNIAKQLPETTNKTLLPLSPNIFTSSSGSTTSQSYIQHHFTQSCTSTLTFSNTSLTISSCTNTSTQVLDFFVNMPNTQNQIESLPMDEKLYNDPLNDETLLKESIETNLDNVLAHNVLGSNVLSESDAENDNQANKKADTLASLDEVPEEEQQSDMTPSTEETNAVLNKNSTETVPKKILEPIPNARDVRNRGNQSASNSKPSGESNSTTCKQAASSQSLSQPNERGIIVAETSKYEFKNTTKSESLLMDENGIVPLSVKQEIVNQCAQLGLKNIVRIADCNLSTIVIDDSDDEAESNQSVKNDIKVEPKFLSNLQFSLDDSNSSVHVHTLQETPAIIIDDDCDVNETVSEADTNLINQLMNPTEQTTFPSLLLSGISSSLLNDTANTLSDYQRLPSSLGEIGSIHQTLQTEPNQETKNSMDTLNNSSEDVELFLEINVQKVVDLNDQDDSSEYELCETKSVDALNLEEDQKSDQSDDQTTILPPETKKSSTKISAKKHKTAVATKLNRQTENKNSHLVPQITHAFRSLPVTVAKVKCNENPKMVEINAAPSTSRICSSATEISNTQVDTNNSGAETTKTVESGSTTKSFSASQALATDCTLFDNSQLLRDLEKVKRTNIETSTVAACAELKATSSTTSMALAASTKPSSQQVPNSNEQCVGSKK